VVELVTGFASAGARGGAAASATAEAAFYRAHRAGDLNLTRRALADLVARCAD
jgi:hypothetical protein